jgi:hypothetical protein
VVEALGAGSVVLDVVGGPAFAEVLAAGGEFADEVREFGVVGVASGFGAEAADGVVGDAVPVAVEVSGTSRNVAIYMRPVG